MSSQGKYASYVERAREFDLSVAKELHLPEEQAHRIIRSVLQALRQHLPVEESLHLIAQLPLIWKGIYVEGWQPMKEPNRLHHLHERLDAIRREDNQLAAFDFGNDQRGIKIFSSVWKALENMISPSELLQICNCLPKTLQSQIRVAQEQTQNIS